MFRSPTRREFLQSAAWSGVAVAAGEWSFLGRLPAVSAQEARQPLPRVAFDRSIEPLVQLIEHTPRERLLEDVAQAIRRGASYREVLAALLLAGVRNVQPRPAVGFKFHCVLVVNACYLASVNGPDADRWLPLFWALDYFKTAQADEASKSGWRMPAVNERLVPDAQHARDLFIEAMERWDVEQADAATAGLVRTTPATEVFQLFARYAARDFRAIGHKAIFLANAWRTLQVIGWEFAEPVLRSLAFALQNHEGDPVPARNDLPADRSWRENEALAARLPAGWLDGRVEAQAARSLCATLHAATPSEAAAAAAQLLAEGVGAASVWDGVFLSAGETLMRQPGIVGLHGLTTANALHYLWQHVGPDDLRRRLLLQACSFAASFREAAQRRGPLQPLTIDSVPAEPDPRVALDDVFAAVSRNRLEAAVKLRSYLAAGGSPLAAIDQARRLIFVKGRDSHDYKFSSAVLEDYSHVTPHWRDQFLALSVFNLKGSGDRDNGLVARTRAALES
uniref:Twin-arginine translocation signal domain-containing protein n=1 Tax=Schlesneria paludicola TaxID=360056 RepID=A0A7C4LL80_9PLAN